MEEKFHILPLRMSIASVWMLSPDYIGIRKHLEDKGYTVEGPEIQRRPDLLAIKGTIEVYSSEERRTLGVRGLTSTSDLVESYKELIDINLDMLGVDPANIMFHEFIGDLTVSTGADPMDVLSKVNQKLDIIRGISSIFEIETAAIGLQIASKEDGPTKAKWLHIIIEPLFVSFRKRYHVRIVYRDAFDSVLNLVKHLETIIKQTISKIEKDARS